MAITNRKKDEGPGHEKPSLFCTNFDDLLLSLCLRSHCKIHYYVAVLDFFPSKRDQKKNSNIYNKVCIEYIDIHTNGLCMRYADIYIYIGIFMYQVQSRYLVYVSCLDPMAPVPSTKSKAQRRAQTSTVGPSSGTSARV